MVGGAAPVPHVDLNKYGCGVNFTTDAAGVWDDERGHGTSGAGHARRHRHRPEPLPGCGDGGRDHQHQGHQGGQGHTGRRQRHVELDGKRHGLHVARARLRQPGPARDQHQRGELGGQPERERQLSRGSSTTGSGSNHQVYVVAAGNDGPNAGTIASPAVAKNALTVGSVLDNTFPDVGDISNISSRGPTGDGRMKPNVVAPWQLGDLGARGQHRRLRGRDGHHDRPPRTSPGSRPHSWSTIPTSRAAQRCSGLT